MDNYMILLSKKSQTNMHNIVTIKKMVKQNQQNIIKIIKKGHKNKCKRVTEIFLAQEKTKKRIYGRNRCKKKIEKYYCELFLLHLV